MNDFVGEPKGLKALAEFHLDFILHMKKTGKITEIDYRYEYNLTVNFIKYIDSLE